MGPGDRVTGTIPVRKRPVSLIWYLIGFIALIVGIVVVSSLVVSYYAAAGEIHEDFEILQENTKNNAVESVWLVNTGLRLIDATMDPQLNRSLARVRDEYVKAGNDPGMMDLPQIRDRIAPDYPGKTDLYIFNADGILEYSTLPDVVGIDFRNYPDFYRELTRVRLGSDFAADAVVRSVENESDLSVGGTLRKFAYLPTPDHRYVLEIGVDSPDFSDVRSQFSYQEMAERLLAVNPDLTGICVWDYYSNPAAVAGDPGTDGRVHAMQAVAARADSVVVDPANQTETRYIFVDLRNPAAVSDSSVVVELRYSTKRLDAATRTLVMQYIVIGICAILMGVLLAFLMFRKLTGEIGAIVKDVGIVADGDLAHTIHSVNTREFAELETGINTMIGRIMAYTEELERKKAELQVAADIQQAFLPKHLPQIPGYEIAAASYPAREVGGDFYDVFPVRDGRYALVIADVSGKGVPASLFMALSRTAVRIVSRWERSARRVLEGSNTIFIEDAGSVSFVTAFYALLDGKECRLAYVNAGHNPPLVLHRDGSIEELGPTGPVIGLVDDPGYGETETGLVQGDILVMYTDGVTEAINRNEVMFGDERLRDAVRESATLPAAGIVREIRDRVNRFCGDMPQFDDMTIVVLKVM